MIIGLAPMDGFTDCAFRQIVKEIFDEYGEKDTYELVLWTEFMNADGYIINPPGVIKHLLTDKNQDKVIAQIFWGNEEMLTKCFSDIEKKYFLNVEGRMQNAEKNSELWTLNSEFSFAGIELNMGCPARNVMNTGWGSALLKDKENTLEIVKKLSWAMKMPFSIKTRTGINEEDRNNQMKFLIEISNYVDMITIHGRTVKQAYTGDADWDFMYELKNKVQGKRDKEQGPSPKSHVPECKIIWNWGIRSYDDIEKAKWNLDGIMIGQAAIGNPRIFTPHIPSREEIKETILKHLDLMISYENYFQEQKENFTGILTMPSSDIIWHHLKKSSVIIISEFRKHLFQYVKWIPWSKEFKQKVATIVDYDQLVKEIQEFSSLSE